MKNNTIKITVTAGQLSYSIRKADAIRKVGEKTECVTLYSSHAVKPSVQTEYFTAVCWEYGTVFARKALKTVNAKSWTEKVENMLYHGDTDFEDIEQEARLAICELFNLGLLKKPSDIFEHSSHVYSRINQKLNSNRRITAVFPCGLYWTDENGEEHVISVGQADKKLEKVERSDVLEYVENILRRSDKIDSRTDVDRTVAVFECIFIGKKTARETAKELSCTLKQVSLHTARIYEALRVPEFHDYLTAIINGQ